MLTIALQIVAMVALILIVSALIWNTEEQRETIRLQKDEIFSLEKRAESAEDQVVAALNSVRQAQEIVDRATSTPAIYSVTCPYDDYLEVVSGLSAEVALEQASAALKAHNELAGHIQIQQQRLMN